MNMLGSKLLPQMSGSFAPISVNNLLLWLDAMDANSIFADIEMTTVAQNGEAVSGWRDKSGNNNNALQSNGAVAPAKTTNGVQTNGTNKYLAIPSISEGDQFTIFCVVTPNDVANSWRTFLGHETYGTNIGWFMWTNAANSVAYSKPTGFTVYTSNDTTRKILTFGKDTNTGYIYKNGVLESSASQPSYNQSNVSLTIGCRHSNDGSSVVDYVAATFHEIAIFSRWLTDTERSEMNEYMASKWGI